MNVKVSRNFLVFLCQYFNSLLIIYKKIPVTFAKE